MTELDRYISTCRAISENGRYQWWARLADLLEGRCSVATHRHKKRGTEYVLVGYGRMQAADLYHYGGDGGYLRADDEEVAIYRGVADGKLWVRPREEFEDGRFEEIADADDGMGSERHD